MRFFYFLLSGFIFSTQLSAQRIISLLPSYTEIIYELGAGDKLVGVTNFCNYPDDAKGKEKVGDYLNPDLEKIYLLKPDIIFVGEWKNDFIKKMRKLNSRIVVLKQEKDINDIYLTIKTIGKYIKREEQSKELISKIKKSIPANINKKYLKVYIEVDKGGWSAGSESFISDVVSKAGGINIFSDIKTPYFKAEWEEVLKRNPDYILLLNTKIDEFKKRPMAAEMKAVKNSNIYLFNEQERDIISRPSPRVVGIIKKLSELFSND